MKRSGKRLDTLALDEKSTKSSTKVESVTSTTTSTTTARKRVEPNDLNCTVVKPRVYSREFSISKAYLDLPSTRMSIHKMIHSYRILIFSLFFLYLFLDDKHHGFFKFIKHLSTLSMIFINPFELVIDLGITAGISFINPIACYFYYHQKINKRVLVFFYLFSQAAIVVYNWIFVLTRSSFPIGTKLFLSIQIIIFLWKTHSYFIIFNYKDMIGVTPNQRLENTHEFKELSIKSESLSSYCRDYFIYLASPTLIYDQFAELRDLKKKGIVPDSRWWPNRFINLIKELYISLAVMTTIHYIHAEYLFPELFKGPSVMSFIKILIPAELTFQLIYYLLYHCVCSLLADLTNFSDRLSFYDNYWEATTCKDILQGWSKPVHSWLYRHTLVDLKMKFGLKRTTILMFFTMIFSGMFHELIVAVTSHNICVPWSTLNLVGCGILIYIESTFKFVSTSKLYHNFIRFFLFLGHAAFYFAYYHFCFSNHLYDLVK